MNANRIGCGGLGLLIALGLLFQPGRCESGEVVPGGSQNPTATAASRVEVLGDALLLDGHAVAFDSLRSAVATRCAASPPAIYHVALPAALECRRVEAILAGIGAGHRAIGQAAQYAHVPILLGLAGGDALDAVAITIPMPAYQAMAYQANTVRHLEIAPQGELRLDGVACEWKRLSSRLSSEPGEGGAAPKPYSAWVYVSAHGDAPFVRLYEALRLARLAEVPCLSLWGPNALIDLEAPAGHRPAKQKASTSTDAKGYPRQFSGFVSPPQPIYRVDPAYPDSAAQLGLGGKVLLLLFVNEFGAVFRTTVLEATGPDCLSDAARTAASQWRFLPGWTGDREVVKTTITVPFEFTPERWRVDPRPEGAARGDSAAPAVTIFGWQPPAGVADDRVGPRSHSAVATLRMTTDGGLSLNDRPVPVDSLPSAIASDCISSKTAVYRLQLPGALEYSDLVHLLRAIRDGQLATDRRRPPAVIPLVLVDPDDDTTPDVPLLIRGRGGDRLLRGPGRLVEARLSRTGVLETDERHWAAPEMAAYLESLKVADRAPSLLLKPAGSASYADLFVALRACYNTGVKSISLPGEEAIVDREAWQHLGAGEIAQWPSDDQSVQGRNRPRPLVDDFRMAEPIQQVAPALSDSLRQATASGKAAILVYIDEAGVVFRAEVISSTAPAAVDSAFVAAARQWLFEPALSDGRAIRCSRVLTFEVPERPVH